MRTLAQYLALVPPLNAGDPNFMAEVALCMAPLADQQAFLASIPAAFDLDVAIGVQLDATGAWIGQSRNIPVPIENPWFSFDTTGLGFDQGYWFGPYDGTALVALDDTTYRRLLYAVRAANQTSGLQASIAAALQIYFDNPATLMFVVDATDYANTPSAGLTSIALVMQVGLAGVLPNVVDLYILQQMLIPVFPAGVEVDWAVTTVNDTPVFGFDVENEYISGFDVGAWGASPAYVAANIVT